MDRVDLNCDLGESFGRYRLGMDEAIIPMISSANIACGYHASDPLVMEETIKRAKEAGIGIGAHPGLNDLMGFGRRRMEITHQEARTYTLYQIGALAGLCRALDAKLSHVKLHGALYNMASEDYGLAMAVCRAVKEFDPGLIILALYGSQMEKAAADCGLRTAREVFADRGYEDDGTLADRKKTGAVILDEEEAVSRTVRMIKEEKVTTLSGRVIPIHADSVCVHGDGESALAFVRKIRTRLMQEEIRICPIEQVIQA